MGSACASISSRHEQAESRNTNPPELNTNSSRTEPTNRIKLSGVSAEEENSYHEIESLFAKGDTAGAENQIQVFKTRFPESALSHGIEKFQGLIWLQKKKPLLAAPHFRKAISLSNNQPSYSAYYQYNEASAYFDAQDYDDSFRILSMIPVNALDNVNRVKVFYLRANIYEKKSLQIESLRQLLSAGRYLSEMDSPDTRTAFDRYLEKSLGEIKEPESLETLYREYEDSPVADAVLFRLANVEIGLQKTGAAEEHLSLMLSRFPKGSLFSKGSELISTLREKTATSPRSIGVLLPMTGRFAKFGSRALQGLELAFEIFDNKPGDSFTLVVEDTTDDPAEAVRALERLVYKNHVVAVIGPMLSKGIEQIAAKANDLGVPLLSLARRETPPTDFVFQTGLTQQIQAYELARYAIEKLKLKKFAILAPNDKMGQEMTNFFWDAVESYGGKIVGMESYPVGETDFRQAVDKLSGLYYSAARQRELDQLAQDRLTNNIKKRNRRTERYFSLTPRVDYEAVLIPDEAKVAGQIIPTFAYRDVEKVQFLGTASWYTPEFISRTQGYSENACFVEAYFPDNSVTTSKKFRENYKKTFEQEPGSIEALAFDSGALIYQILRKNPINSRIELRNRLRELKDFSGVTGKLTFKDGQFFRNLRLLSVKNGKFAELD